MKNLMKKILFILNVSSFNMKYLLTVCCLLVPAVPVCLSEDLEPVKHNIGKLEILVDPRMELLGAVQITSGYFRSPGDTPHANRIRSYFSGYEGEKAVAYTTELSTGHTFSYDAPVVFMLYLSQPPALRLEHPYTGYQDIIRRAGGEDNLEKYRDYLGDFARKSNFPEFWNSNIDFYRKVTGNTTANLSFDMVKALEDYYNETRNSYTIVLNPTMTGNNYGLLFPAGNGKNNLYAVFSPPQDMYDGEGIPVFPVQFLLYVGLHEFSHSFVNPLTEAYPEKVMASEKLFAPIAPYMQDQAMGTWEGCVKEHVVRAVVIRLIEQLKPEMAGEVLEMEEKMNHFVYIRPVLEKLKEYEKLRDKDQITFSDYYPALLDALAGMDPYE